MLLLFGPTDRGLVLQMPQFGHYGEIISPPIFFQGVACGIFLELKLWGALAFVSVLFVQLHELNEEGSTFLKAPSI